MSLLVVLCVAEGDEGGSNDGAVIRAKEAGRSRKGEE